MIDNLLKKFQNYLIGSKKLSKSSIKNYISDVHIFLVWLKQSLQEESLSPKNITKATITAYREHLNHGRQSLAGKNRRLSSLRHFGYFLSSTELTENDPTSHLKNLDPATTSTTTRQLLRKFKAALKNENLAPSSVKNYFSDAKQYLNWALNNR